LHSKVAISSATACTLFLPVQLQHALLAATVLGQNINIASAINGLCKQCQVLWADGCDTYICLVTATLYG
jgi:hypothetical protein